MGDISFEINLGMAAGIESFPYRSSPIWVERQWIDQSQTGVSRS
jgi:hypothetical protein